MVLLAPLAWAVLLRAYSRRAPVLPLAVPVAAMLAITALAALSGWSAHWERTPPPMLLLMMPVLAGVVALVFFLPTGRTFARLPQSFWMGLQAVRLPLELFMASMAGYGLLPMEMTFHGRNFDILTGLAALPAAFLVARRGEYRSRALVLAFNLCGLGLALWVVGHGLLSAPTAFQKLHLSMDNRWLAYFPWIWLPLGVVPLAFLAHAVSLRKLWLSR